MNFVEIARKYEIAIIDNGYGTTSIMRIFKEHLKPEDCIATEKDTYIFTEAPSFFDASTYESCMFWKYNPCTKKLYIRYAYGDMVYGKPNGYIKGAWTFKVEDDSPLFEKVFNSRLDSELKHLAETMFEDAEAQRRQYAIQRIYDQMLNGGEIDA